MIRISGSFFASAAPAIEAKPRAKQNNPLPTEIRPTGRREAFPPVVAVWRTGSTSYGPAIIAVYPDNKLPISILAILFILRILPKASQ
jgi:hypothetical protein